MITVLPIVWGGMQITRFGAAGRDQAMRPASLMTRRCKAFAIESGGGDMCERVARQFRCVGDALAWRVFGFERRNIIALCQNAPPGVWAGKAGAAAELDAVEQAYRQDGQFAILHDMTNCLRIGDVTIFRSEGTRETIEVKADPERSRSAQQRRIKAANDALNNAAPLPGTDRRARLLDLDVQFKTHMDLLALGSERAAREGIFAARVRGDQALLIADIFSRRFSSPLAEPLGQRVSGDRREAAARHFRLTSCSACLEHFTPHRLAARDGAGSTPYPEWRETFAS